MENLSEGRWLRSAIAERGFSISEFARKANVSRASLHVWVRQPILNIEPQALLRVLATLGFSVKRLQDDLRMIESAEIGERDRAELQIDFRRKIMNFVRWVTSRDPGERVTEAQAYELTPLRGIPFYDVSVPAADWVDTEPRQRADGMVEVPAGLPRDAFALRIFGDCMEPDYASGSIIVFVPVRPGEDGAAQFEDGKDYYFEHSDGKATFKRVFFEKSKERWKLVPLNKKYKPIYVPEQMRARLSRAVRLVRDL